MLEESTVNERLSYVSPPTAASTVISNSYAVDAVKPLSVFDDMSVRPSLAYPAS